MMPPSSRSGPMRMASLVTAINVLVAGGFSIAGLVSPQSILPPGYAPTNASFIFAMYAGARSIPLALMVLIAIYQRSESALRILGALAGFIQLLDAGVGLLQHDLGKSIGPLVIAALQFVAVYRLSGTTPSSGEERPPDPEGTQDKAPPRGGAVLHFEIFILRCPAPGWRSNGQRRLFRSLRRLILVSSSPNH